MIENVMMSMGAGVVYSLTAYMKKEKQKFDWNKFLITVGFGAGIGLISSYMNMSIEVAEEFALSIGFIVVLENLSKAVYRKTSMLMAKSK